MFSKKGQASEQFNWIFAIVAGGIILLFFLFVLGQVKASADSKLAVTVLNNFDAIITGSSVTPNSLNIIDSTKLIEFDVSCEDDGLSELTLKGTDSRLSLSQRVLFSPKSSGGQRLYLYVKSIDRPFNLGNALLLTGNDVLFAFYDAEDSDGLNEIYDMIPENISKEKVAMFNNNHKAYKRIVVFSTQTRPDFSNSYDDLLGQNILKKKNVMWIDLDFESDVATKAQVYLKSETDKGFEWDNEVTLNSNDLALFLGFSKDVSFYECNMNKINKKLGVVAKIYLERVNFLISNPNVKSSCVAKYISAQDVLSKIIESNSGYFEDDIVSQLKEVNHGLLINSCPLIY